MPQRTEASMCLIIDDFLGDEAWSEVWTPFQFAALAPVTGTAGAWKTDDGTPLSGDVLVTPPRDQGLRAPGEQPGRFPSGTALDHVLAEVLGGAPHTVTPVRAAAGSNVRASISGFHPREPIADEA